MNHPQVGGGAINTIERSSTCSATNTQTSRNTRYDAPLLCDWCHIQMKEENVEYEISRNGEDRFFCRESAMTIT
jgi:hypothetical protein